MHSLILKPQQYLEMSPKTALKKKKIIGAFTRFFFFLGGGEFYCPPKKMYCFVKLFRNHKLQFLMLPRYFIYGPQHFSI